MPCLRSGVIFMGSSLDSISRCLSLMFTHWARNFCVKSIGAG